MTAATSLTGGTLGRLRAWTGGDGPPVVLVHGLGGSARNWVDVVPLLTPRYRVVAVDLPGHGGSPAPARGAAVADYVGAVREAIERSALPAPLVVGHSFGAHVTASLAVSSPGLVGGALLLAPSGLSTTRRASRVVVTATGRARPSVLAAALLPRLGQCAAFRAATLTGLVADARRVSARGFRGQLVDVRAHASVRSAGRAMTHDDARRWARPPGRPVLVLWGARDTQVRVGDAVAWSRLLQAPLRVVADCGHLLPVERPAAVADAVAALAARVTRGSPPPGTPR
jgi:pimeloyl-ACP methyl ester carboxylesterase